MKEKCANLQKKLSEKSKVNISLTNKVNYQKNHRDKLEGIIDDLKSRLNISHEIATSLKVIFCISQFYMCNHRHRCVTKNVLRMPKRYIYDFSYFKFLRIATCSNIC